jgi:hypothetical protein
VKILRSALDVLRRERRFYLALNLAYYGLIAGAMAYTCYDRSPQEALGQLVAGALGEGPLAPVLEALTAGQVLQAVGLILAINLLAATFLVITLPSLIVPFSGLLLVALRALLWGILFAPQIGGPVEMRELLTGIGVAVLILLEGQGYVLGALGVTLQGRAFLWPRSVGASSRGQGYLYGLKEQARVYLLIVPVLLIAAVYEVWLALAAGPPS